MIVCIALFHIYLIFPFVLQEMVENKQISAWEGYVDWRRKPALIGKHGGMLAASFVLGNFISSLGCIIFLVYIVILLFLSS